MNNNTSLRDWLWDNRLTPRQFALKYNLQYQTILSIVKNEKTPRLGLALIIHKITKGKVPIESLLSKKDQREYRNWDKSSIY